MADRIQIRRDTAANWTSSDPTLAQGEMGFETDTLKIKFGDGSTAWTALSYYSPTETDPIVGAINGIVKADGGGNISAASAGTDYLVTVVQDTTPQLGGELDAQAHSIGFTLQTAMGDGTTTIDWRVGNKFKFQFGAANETFTFTAPSKPCSLQIILIQDSVGSRTATWPATVKWPSGTAPTLTTTATTGTDIVSFLYDGTNYYGVGSLDFS